MVSRRTFLSLAAASVAAPRLVSAQQPAAQKVAIYANVGPDLIHYDVDVAGAELIKRETMTVTGGIQYAWPHASRRYLMSRAATARRITSESQGPIISSRHLRSTRSPAR